MLVADGSPFARTTRCFFLTPPLVTPLYSRSEKFDHKSINWINIVASYSIIPDTSATDFFFLEI